MCVMKKLLISSVLLFISTSLRTVHSTTAEVIRKK